MRLYRSLLRRYEPQRFALSRRAFISGAAGLALLRGPVARAVTAPAQPPNGKRVIVVGAGFAGLACGYELQRAGFDVQILEARERVSGRVLSFRDWIPGKIAEGGAELIGSNHPLWHHYATVFGLTYRDMSDWPEASRPILLGNHLLNEPEKQRLFEELDVIYGQAMTDLARPVIAETPWTTPDAAALDAQSLGDFVRAQHPSDFARQAIEAELGADNAVPIDKQSLLGMLTMIKGGGLEHFWTDTELYRCEQGNDMLGSALETAIGPGRIHRSNPAAAVIVTATGVRVIDSHGAPWTGDYVVLAIPPSTWGNLAFTPALPGWLTPQMGLNVKFLAHLQRDVWSPNSPDALTTHFVSESWNGTDHQPGPGGECMVGFSGADAAAEAMRLYQASGPRNFIDLFTFLYPAYRGQFLSARFMDWPNEFWTKCGYSNAAPGQVTALGPTLYNGLGRLQFAGEHSCYKFAGYMEGALQSGVRAASMIAAQEHAAQPKAAMVPA